MFLCTIPVCYNNKTFRPPSPTTVADALHPFLDAAPPVGSHPEAAAGAVLDSIKTAPRRCPMQLAAGWVAVDFKPIASGIRHESSHVPMHNSCVLQWQNIPASLAHHRRRCTTPLFGCCAARWAAPRSSGSCCSGFHSDHSSNDESNSVGWPSPSLRWKFRQLCWLSCTLVSIGGSAPSAVTKAHKHASSRLTFLSRPQPFSSALSSPARCRSRTRCSRPTNPLWKRLTGSVQ